NSCLEVRWPHLLLFRLPYIAGHSPVSWYVSHTVRLFKKQMVGFVLLDSNFSLTKPLTMKREEFIKSLGLLTAGSGFVSSMLMNCSGKPSSEQTTTDVVTTTATPFFKISLAQ